MKTIQRDNDGLALTRYCHEELGGGVTITVGPVSYELSRDKIADGPAFAETLQHLQAKQWFNESVQCDLTNVVTSRWLAKARGWI